MKRDDLVGYLDDYLQIRTIEDSSDNGLQVEGSEVVNCVAFAVDAGLMAFEEAHAAGAEMLVVHHGIFWGRPVMVRGVHGRRLRQLFETGLSLYAVHLPLDFHQEVGNNVTLARWLDLQDVVPFGEYMGHSAGIAGRLPAALALDRFVAQVEELLQEPVVRIWPFGPAEVRQLGIATGKASSHIDQAAKAGLDLYLTGEMDHSSYHLAQDLGLNVLYAGHYATEKAGLKALSEHLARRFGLRTVFLDLPTGA